MKNQFTLESQTKHLATYVDQVIKQVEIVLLM
jgi:hypothetical protein